MNRRTVGWLWVLGQVVVLGLVIFVPGRDDWSNPGWVSVIAAVLFFGGLALVAVAALGLGSALTPTPVPTETGTLTTTGLYGLARHPIYSGVLAIVAGMTLRSTSWVHVGIAVAAYVFFDRKAAWEEQMLSERYPDYPAYAAHTPRFIPRPFR